MHNPLDSIPQSKRKPVFWILFAATLAWMLLMQLVGMPLITSAAPSGIVTYELVGSLSGAQTILNTWDVQARLHAAFSLGIDYVFMLLYSTTIALGCLWSGQVLQKRGWPLGELATGIAWGQWAAAIFDALENIALIAILFGSLVSPWPEIARWCALLKFALIFIGLVYAFLGLIAYIMSFRQT